MVNTILLIHQHTTIHIKSNISENLNVCVFPEIEMPPEAPPAPVISAEYDAEEDEGDSDDDNIPDAPRPPVISKQEVHSLLM